MAAGEMSRDDFAAFLRLALGAALARVVDGGLVASFIDWRSIDLLIACGRDLGLELLNLVVWAKSNASQGSLWRSQHELAPFFKKGAGGARQQRAAWPSRPLALEHLDLRRRILPGLGRARGLGIPPHG